MPVNVSYPGVYIEEIPSGVRTIVGVSTSITAFLGRAAKGPTDSATAVFSWSDFARQYGGLDVAYPITYAVRDFFANGGSQAVIVRLYRPDAADATGRAVLPLDAASKLTLEASSAGPWADGLLAVVSDAVSADVAASYGLAASDLFNLSVRLGPTGSVESFLNVTVAESPRRVDRVLAAESALVRLQPLVAGAKVPKHTTTTDDHPSVWDPANAYQVADTKGSPGGACRRPTTGGPGQPDRHVHARGHRSVQPRLRPE